MPPNDNETPMEASVDTLDLTGERRDAILAVLCMLRDQGEAQARAFEPIYQEYPCGYSSRRTWWLGFVMPAIQQLPVIEKPQGPPWVWRYTGEESSRE